jgi:hypothetical protein
MVRQPTAVVRFAILTAASPAFAVLASAQNTNHAKEMPDFVKSLDRVPLKNERLDKLADQIAKELKSRNPRLVAFADFRPPYGRAMPQGHYFSLILSGMLQDLGKKKFAVADHIGFDSDIAK